MEIKKMTMSEIKEYMKELEKYKEIVLNVGEITFGEYKDLLIKKRIEEFPKEKIELLLDISKKLHCV